MQEFVNEWELQIDASSLEERIAEKQEEIDGLKETLEFTKGLNNGPS